MIGRFTKSCVTGNIAFYIQNNSKTFRNMFLERNDVNLDFNALPKIFHVIINCVIVLYYNISNRIVVPYKENKIYLIQVFEIQQTGES